MLDGDSTREKVMEGIGRFTLKNEGAFFCSGGVESIDEEGFCSLSLQKDSLGYGNRCVIRIGGGTFVRLYVHILGGIERRSDRFFRYDPGNPRSANYRITGTTLDSALHCEISESPE